MKINRPGGVVLLFFLGLALRFLGLGDKSLWLDEACSLYQARKPIPLLIKEAFSYDLHPPLYSVLLHYWIKIGEGEFALRFLSGLAGFLSLIVFYKLAELILNKKESLIALSFFTFSSLAVFFSQEVRPYGLFLLEANLLSYLFLKIMYSGRKRYPLFYILTGIVSIYTHLYTFLIFLSQALYLILVRRREREKKRLIVFSLLIVFILFLPWWPALSAKAHLFKGEGGGMAPGAGLKETLIQFNFGLNIITPTLSLMLAILLVLIIIYVLFFSLKEDKREEIIFAFFSLILPLSVILLYPGRIHPFRVKEAIFISPFWYIILAWAIGKLKPLYKTLLVSLWLTGNIITLVGYYSPQFIKEDWRGAAFYLASKESEREAIIFNPSYLGFPFDYYYRGSLPRGTIESGEEAKRLRERFDSLWLIENTSYLTPPLKQTRPLIEARFKKGEKFVLGGYLGDIVITKFY